MCGSGASPTATTSWAGNTSEWSASSPTRSVYSEAHRGKGPDGARARCGSDRLRPPRSKQGVPSLRRRSLAAASEEGFRLKVCQLVEGGRVRPGRWGESTRACSRFGGCRPATMAASRSTSTSAYWTTRISTSSATLPRSWIRTAACAAPRWHSCAGGGRDGGPQPRRGAKGPAAQGVHLPRQGVRRLGRRPPRGRRHRRHHQRRSAGPPAQRRQRVGVPPIGQPLARLEQ
jgi:hypothetical protein